jgi:hypothetical protein
MKQELIYHCLVPLLMLGWVTAGAILAIHACRRILGR